MDILVCYDVNTETKEGRKRLRQVAQLCKNFGQRVQKSVFECSVNEMRLERLRNGVVKIMKEEEDSVRIYRLLEPRERYVEEYGRNTYVDFEEPLMV